MALSKEDRLKMFEAYKVKQTIGHVVRETGRSHPTVKKVMIEDDWQGKLGKELIAKEEGKIESITNHFKDEMDMFQAILKKIGNQIFSEPDRKYTVADLRQMTELVLLYGGIDPRMLGSKGAINVNIQNNNTVEAPPTESVINPASTVLTSEERTAIYKTLNKAKERTNKMFQVRDKDEIVVEEKPKDDCIIEVNTKEESKED